MATTVKNASGQSVPVETDLLTVGSESAQVQGIKLVLQISPQVGETPGTGVDAPGTEDGGLLVEVSNPPADPATETTLAALVAAQPSDPATETTLAGVAAALAPLGTEATLQDLLSALGPLATEATLADVLTALGSLSVDVGNLPDDPSTETTAAAILAALLNPLTVEGTVTAGGTATELTLEAVLAKLSSDPATQTTLAAVLAKLSADPATQTTSAAILAALASVPVTGTFWQTTQPVSGPLTDTQLRATAVPVSGTVTASGPLTDTQLRASAVPVSGPVTDTQLRASAVPVSAAALPLPSGASTETTVAAILAKLIAAPATAAGQATEHTDLAALLTGIILAAGEAHIGALGGQSVSVTVAFARPNDSTPYSAGDVVSDSTGATTMQNVANFARVNAGSGYITGARLTTDKKSITPRIRVHLYNTTGATLAVDNANFKRLYADDSKRIGYFDLPAMLTPQDSGNSTESGAQDLGLRIPFVCAAASRSIYYVLEALDAFTPAAQENFSLTLVGDLN